jgi:nitrite reductase/ring-hydroxylating ferredoxin subunit
MLVLTFAVDGAGNCVEVAGWPYVFARTRLGSFVLRARCPHRGGPLHLGAFERDGNRLICPWHGRANSVTRLVRTGVPAVRRGNRVTAVFPADGTDAHVVGYRPVSADLRAGAGRARSRVDK